MCSASYSVVLDRSYCDQLAREPESVVHCIDLSAKHTYLGLAGCVTSVVLGPVFPYLVARKARTGFNGGFSKRTSIYAEVFAPSRLSSLLRRWRANRGKPFLLAWTRQRSERLGDGENEPPAHESEVN